MAALDESYQTLTLSVFAYSFSYSFTLRLHRLSMCGRGEEGGEGGDRRMLIKYSCDIDDSNYQPLLSTCNPVLQTGGGDLHT